MPLISHVDAAFECIEVHSKSYPCLRLKFNQTSHIFQHADPRAGLSHEVIEWCDMNSYKLFEDFFVRVDHGGAGNVDLFFRNQDIGSIFRLRFL